MAQVPSYHSEPALVLAKERIQHPERSTDFFKGRSDSFKHQVGTWACTMLCKYFSQGFLITPCMPVVETGYKLDFVVEKFCENGVEGKEEEGDKSKYHVVYVFDKQDGHSFYEALDDVDDAISELCCQDDRNIDLFVIVQVGMQIGFFEYMSDHEHSYAIDTPHFANSVPITYMNENLLFNDDDTPTSEGSVAKSKLIPFARNLPEHMGSLDYLHSIRPPRLEERENFLINLRLPPQPLEEIPCIFHLETHKNEIEFLFHYMATHEPRLTLV